MVKSSIFKSKLTRTSIKVSAACTPTISASDTPFSNNSRASVAAIAELSECLDFMFDQVNYQDEPGDLLQLHLGRLTEEAAKYGNASLDEYEAEGWNCSAELAQLVHIACQCSNLVYGPVRNQDADLARLLNRTPSITGTNKAFSIWKVDSLKALAVSVRGTSCVADHMVNLNAEVVDASRLLGIENTVSAHRGFLTCAKAILPMVNQELAKQVASDKSISQIIFTGHSAGGAVSSLLFLSLAFNMPAQMSHLTTSLITFGSAPVTSANISDLARKLPNVGSVLAFVNEYDIVPRADTPYVKSVIDLYRSKYELSSINDRGGVEEGQVAPDGFKITTSETEKVLPLWSLPQSTCYPVGDIIISKGIMQDAVATTDTASELTMQPTVTYKMFKVPHEVFGKLLFCGLGVHKRKVYLERVRSTLDLDTSSWSDSTTLRTVGSHSSNGTT